MRLAVVFATLVGLTGLAAACPPADACLAKLRARLHEPLKPVETETATPAHAPVTRALLLPGSRRRMADDAVEMPWIWRALREQVYSNLPTYRDRNALTVTLSPVVVTSPTDTIPGLGIAGAF